MASNEEYLEDRKYLMKTLDRVEANIEKLFENDKQIEIHLNKLDTKIIMYGTIAGFIATTAVTVILKVIGL